MKRTSPRTLAALLVAGAPVLVPAAAGAQQIDTNPPLPNVLLLVDNSGSMERMIDGTLPENNTGTTCNCDATTGSCNFSAQPSSPNRWGVMLQALTGTFQTGYNCAAMPRTPGTVFANEYQINGVPPYDINYYLAYHRPIANDGNGNSCVYAPGALPGAQTPTGVGPSGNGFVPPTLATDFPAGAIVQSRYGTFGATACAFPQLTDGALDAQRDVMRFGLMTFDQDPDPSTGVNGAMAVVKPAFTGMWSYFPGWNTGGACTYYGGPAYCSQQTLMAVGARNPAAPPWEGRMMMFPVKTDIASQETSNDNIQQVLLASRPYGATPLAGMFVGAQYYLQTDPSGPNGDSTHVDPYVQGGCRNQYIILLTDGAPNLDMRPSCNDTVHGGHCPFPYPEQTALSLNQKVGSAAAITTYVIGFAVSSFQDQGTQIHCSNLVTNGTLASQCTNPTPLYAPCCELEQIALFGGTNHAYFADTPGDLSSALGTILSQIANKATTRTTPVYSPVITNNVVSDPTSPATNAQIFLASFNPSPGQAWSGDVQRQRYVCKGQTGGGFSVSAPLPDKTVGDDFAANVNSAPSGSRFFVALEPDTPTGNPLDSTKTIRPYVSTTVGDGLGQYSATTYTGKANPGNLANITPDALNLTANSCTYNPVGGGTPQKLSAASCRDLLLDYTFGLSSFSSNPGNYPFKSRYGNAFGDIFHATPAVVGPPGSLLRDDGYINYASTTSGYGSRKQILYAATNDGLLHAFWADENKLENNELWALLPPAVMPNILQSYPSSHLYLLDGSPIVKDVVWERPVSKQGDPTTWHTTLVAGFGPSEPGYYAVDVTNPDPTGMPANAKAPADPPTSGLIKGPVFLWQLTTMPATNRALFGAHSGTPAITTLYMNPDNTTPREIGVAILPGGQNSGPTTSLGNGSACTRCKNTAGCTTATSDATPMPATSYTARTSVRCWGSTQSPMDYVIGRSLSVVRLDTGEIVRVFMRLTDVPQSTDTLYKANPSRIIDTPLDSPMTGIPVVYPSDVGTDASRVFVSDADGTIWRFDLSNTDPSKWVGEMFLDLYNTTKADTTANAWGDGQPVEVPPVTSLDTQGNVVLNVATGSQAQFDTTGIDFVYSISEKVDTTSSPNKFRATVNWWLNPQTVTSGQLGERVSGPMTVFDGALYFATYEAANPQALTCTSGHGRIWGLDFVAPLDSTALYKGGLARMALAPNNHNGQYIQPDETDSTLSGVVIPGVSIKSAPACSGLNASTNDQYVGGAMHQTPSGMSSAPSYSLFTQLGKPGSNGAATQQFELGVPTPVSPTMIDSWAAVLE